MTERVIRAMNRLTAAFVVPLLLTGCASLAPSPSIPAPTAHPAASPVGTPYPITSQSTPIPPTAAPLAETDGCVPEAQKSVYIGSDPCPPAMAAVHGVVARLGLSIARIVLRPQPFNCGTLWPGVGAPQICFGPFVMPGTTMHGWVGFVGSSKVAAVSLRLQPATGPSPAPSPMWVATIEAFEIPPAGWVMP